METEEENEIIEDAYSVADKTESYRLQLKLLQEIRDLLKEKR